MRLLLDEMMDQRLTGHFVRGSHECVSAKEAELTGLLNGELLAKADLMGFDVLITTDKNIQYQNNLTGKKIALLIIRVFKNKLSFVLPHLPEALLALESIRPGEIKHVGERSLIAKNTQP